MMETAGGGDEGGNDKGAEGAAERENEGKRGEEALRRRTRQGRRY